MGATRTAVHGAVFSTLLTFASSARADFYIIVNANNPQPTLSQNEALNFFMGRSRAFANGEFALIFDLPRDSPKRAGFYHMLTGMSPAQVTSYWSRLMFSGQSLPPQPLPDEATVVEIVKHNANAIAWISSAPTDKGLRTLLVLKEPP
jgi:hypothetical protein